MPTTAPSTLPLHDALPIFHRHGGGRTRHDPGGRADDRDEPAQHATHNRTPPAARAAHAVWRLGDSREPDARTDRKSTRLNSSQPSTSYAVSCLKKKKERQK